MEISIVEYVMVWLEYCDIECYWFEIVIGCFFVVGVVCGIGGGKSFMLSVNFDVKVWI